MIGDVVEGRYEVKGVVNRGRDATTYHAIEQLSGAPVTLQFFDHLADTSRHTLPQSLEKDV